MKHVHFVGSAKEALRAFPKDARQDAGYQLDKLQRGKQPDDFKPLPSVGRGVEELRVWKQQGTFRVVYVAKFADVVYVLHAFQKKSGATPAKDLALAKERCAHVRRLRKSKSS